MILIFYSMCTKAVISSQHVEIPCCKLTKTCNLAGAQLNPDFYSGYPDDVARFPQISLVILMKG